MCVFQQVCFLFIICYTKMGNSLTNLRIFPTKTQMILTYTSCCFSVVYPNTLVTKNLEIQNHPLNFFLEISQNSMPTGYVRDRRPMCPLPYRSVQFWGAVVSPVPSRNLPGRDGFKSMQAMPPGDLPVPSRPD